MLCEYYMKWNVFSAFGHLWVDLAFYVYICWNVLWCCFIVIFLCVWLHLLHSLFYYIGICHVLSCDCWLLLSTFYIWYMFFVSVLMVYLSTMKIVPSWKPFICFHSTIMSKWTVVTNLQRIINLSLMYIYVQDYGVLTLSIIQDAEEHDVSETDPVTKMLCEY